MIVFETERLRVRHFTKADKDNFFALTGSHEVMQYIRAVKTKEQSDTYLKEVLAATKANPKLGRWAVEDKINGRFIGQFAIIPMPAMPERTQLGYSLTPENWGKGFATELTMEGLNYFRKFYAGTDIYGITEKQNISSQKVLLKAGFQSVGTIQEEEKELLLFIYPA